MPAFDPLVLDRKSVFFQRIADYVRHGYQFWVGGEVPLERAQALSRKFARLYGVDFSRNQRAYAKSHGRGCGVLLFYAPHADGDRPHTNRLMWVLLVTAGENLAHTVEKLSDAGQAGGRIAITGYELVQLPRAGQAKPAWTWRMTETTYSGWRERVLRCARVGTPSEIDAALSSLYAVPGFAGIRSQVGRILALFRREWRRRRAAPLPGPRRLPYVQRLASRGWPLSARCRAARRPA